MLQTIRHDIHMTEEQAKAQRYLSGYLRCKRRVEIYEDRIADLMKQMQMHERNAEEVRSSGASSDAIINFITGLQERYESLTLAVKDRETHMDDIIDVIEHVPDLADSRRRGDKAYEVLVGVFIYGKSVPQVAYESGDPKSSCYNSLKFGLDTVFCFLKISDIVL